MREPFESIARPFGGLSFRARITLAAASAVAIAVIVASAVARLWAGMLMLPKRPLNWQA